MKHAPSIVLLVTVLAVACDDGAPDPVILEALVRPPNQATVGQQVMASVRARRGQSNASGVTVTWTVESGGGSVTPTSTVTDAEGRAQVTWTLGTATAENAMAASSGEEPVRFTVLTRADQPASITIVSGNAQSATVGQQLPDSLVVRVNDLFDNPVPQAIVSFTTNDGTFTPPTVVTGNDGRAAVRWRLSTRSGQQQAMVSLDANRRVEFTATATPGPLVSGSIAPPTAAITAGDSIHLLFVGLDQYGNQVPNATATYASADTTIAVVTANNALRGLTAGTVRITGQSGQVTSTIDLTWDPFRYARLTVGADHTCAGTPDNRLYCFGGGAQGQLGAGDTGDRLIPTEVSGARTYLRASANSFFTCGVASNENVFCWGRNQEAQIGNGTATLTPVTSPAPILSGGPFTDISTRAASACAQTGDDRVLCWGGGILNIAEHSNSIDFVTIAGSPVNGHACGLTSNGTAYCWGRNNLGQLGTTTVTDSNTPALVAGPQFATIAVGDEHTCALTTVGELYCWGRADLGQLGYLTSATDPIESCSNTSCRKIPTLVPGTEFVLLSAFASSNCAVGLDGESYCWGRDDGHLGNTVANSTRCNSLCDPTPTRVETVQRFTRIAVGATHTCGLRSQGDLFCWGANEVGQTGRNQRSAAGELQGPMPVYAPRR
jgi:alpha-tubulin suppressor-like RCC1 family protein